MILRCYGTYNIEIFVCILLIISIKHIVQCGLIHAIISHEAHLCPLFEIESHELQKKKSKNIFHFIFIVEYVCTHVWANFQICYHSLVQMVTHRICMWSMRIKVINFIKWNDENIRFALNFIHKASIYCGERMKNFRTQMWTLLHTAQMNRCHYNAWQLRYHLPAIQQTLLKQ